MTRTNDPVLLSRVAGDPVTYHPVWVVTILYVDISDRVIGVSEQAVVELCDRARRTPGSEDIATLIETTDTIKHLRLSDAEIEKLRAILVPWAAEVGIDRLWPGARELLLATS